jgi:DNA topoisomerase-2
MPVINKTISEFLDKDYKEFAIYTLKNRAIPSVIDGFKPTQRKIIHVANNIWKTGNEKPLKVFMLAGRVASEAFYHHGDQSLNDAIINMAQSFKNNLVLLAEEGQYGSLRSPSAGGPRYIGTKLTPNFHLIYKDKELLEYKEEEGYKIEPYFFLPIIPTVLVNGSMGMSVGFKSDILNRNPIEVIDACLAHLGDKKVNPISPYYPNYNGTIIQDKENHLRWIIRGDIEVVNTTTVKINELPPSHTFEDYEEFLNELENEPKARSNYKKGFEYVIESYTDNTKKGRVGYTVKFVRSVLSTILKKGLPALWKYFQAEESKTESFICLDEKGNFIQFKSAEELIIYFVNFRLKYYHKRKENTVLMCIERLHIMNEKARFIDLIIKGKLKVQNLPKTKVIEQLEGLKFKKFDGDFEYLLRMPISSLTIDMYNKLLGQVSECEIELKTAKASNPKEIYIEELKELKKKIKV